MAERGTVVYQKNGFHGIPVEISTTSGEDDEGVLEWAQSFVIELADILLRVSKEGDGQITSQLVYFANWYIRRDEMFKRYIKSFAD